MQDISVGVQGLPVRSTPMPVIYAILVNDGSKKTVVYLCKMVEKSNNFVDIVGFKTQLSMDSMPDLSEINKMVSSADRSAFQQLTFPWQSVVTLRNLSFRAK